MSLFGGIRIVSATTISRKIGEAIQVVIHLVATLSDGAARDIKKRHRKVLFIVIWTWHRPQDDADHPRVINKDFPVETNKGIIDARLQRVRERVRIRILGRLPILIKTRHPYRTDSSSEGVSIGKVRGN